MASVKKLLVHEAPISYGAMAKYVSTDELKAKFTTTSRFDDVIQLYEESQDGQFIFLPRAVCPVGANDNRIRGFAAEWEMRTSPKDAEQTRVYGEALALVQDDQSFIVQAGTGTGKTWIGLALACALGRVALVIVPKDDLVKQWRDRIVQHTTIKVSEIGTIQQDKCDVYGKKIVIASLKSLSIPDRYPVGIRAIFGVVIYDEVHRLAADTFQVVCRMFPAAWRIGLSATPTRVDGKEIVFFANIGPIRVIGVGVPMAPKVLRYHTTWVCPRQKVTDPKTGLSKIQRIPHAPGTCGHVLKYLTRDVDRNRLLQFQMQSCFKNNRRTVVFGHIIDHLEMLQGMAVKAGVPQQELGVYYGKMSGAQMDKAVTKKLIFATPGKMGEGTDTPWIDACILVSPISNVEQIVGRVLREYPDKPQPVVFDNVDDDSPVFRGYATSRQNYYERVGATIREMKASGDAAVAA